MNFLEKYIVRKIIKNLQKGFEVETSLPCKVSETRFMLLGVYYFRNFEVCPG